MAFMRITSTLCVSVALVCSVALAQQKPDVRWSNDRLTVRTNDAPLADIVDEVARTAGIEVIGRDKLRGRATLNVADQPLDKALAVILEGVNYSIQEKPAANGTARQLILRIASMAGGATDAAPVRITGPLASPALDALVAEALLDHEDQVDVDLDDDPDYYEEIRTEKLAAAKLASEGAFGPKAELDTLIKLTENYNDYVRLEAIKALGSRSMTPEVLMAIAKMLGDLHWDVRIAAVEILGRAKDAESLQRVGQLLVKDDERDVRVDALRVIALRAQQDSLVHLRAYLKTAPGIDEDLLRSAAQQMINELEWRAQAARGERR
jgi:hypothetical protein